MNPLRLLHKMATQRDGVYDVLMSETKSTLDRFKAGEGDHFSCSASSRKGRQARGGVCRHMTCSPPHRPRVLLDGIQDVDETEEHQQQQENESDNANSILGDMGEAELDRSDEGNQASSFSTTDRAAHEPLRGVEHEVRAVSEAQ